VDSEGALVNPAYVLAPGETLTRAWCESRPNITTSTYFAANNITVPPERHYQVGSGNRAAAGSGSAARSTRTRLRTHYAGTHARITPQPPDPHPHPHPHPHTAPAVEEL
jgi:hypothetical protein